MTANYQSDTVSVLLGQGNGVFGAPTNYSVGLDPMAVALGDLDLDGHLDLVTADSGDGKVTVRYGTGTGTFGTAQQLAVATYPSDVVLADVSGDGRLDILAASLTGNVAYLRSTATGFAPLELIPVGNTPFSLIVQDMDRDNIADLVTASYVYDSFAIRKGLGDGTFASALTHSVEAPGQSGIYQPFAIVAGDLTGEGDPDVVVANYQNYPYLGSQPWSVSVITRKAATAEHFSYDAAGVRTGAGSGGAYVAGDHNELDSDGKYSYQYDRLGNLSLRTETATGKVTEYAWDNHNRLTKVTYKASAGSATTGTAEYAYDMNGRRIRRKVDVDGLAGFEIDERFAYDRGKPAGPQAGAQWDLALVFDAAGSLTNRYLSADAIDAALAEDDFSGGQANATEWLLADHQGSVRDIVRETGSEVTHVSYDSFGNITGVTGGVPVAPRIGYTGQERDPETGLWYYGARYYDPKTGRFLSQDPTGFGAGDTNLYRYVMNSPVIFVDPTGLRQQTPNAFQSLWSGAQAVGSLLAPGLASAANLVGTIARAVPDFSLNYQLSQTSASGSSTTSTSIGWQNGSPYFNQSTSLQTYVGRNQSSTLLGGSPEFRDTASYAPEIRANDNWTPPVSDQQIDSPWWAGAKEFGSSLVSGTGNVLLGAGKMFAEMGATVVDAVGVTADAVSTSFGVPLGYQEMSSAGQSYDSSRSWYSQTAERTVNTAVNVVTLGTAEVYNATSEYLQTGDSAAFQQRMGAMAGGTLLGAAAAGKVHGNALASPRTAYLYRLEDAQGNLLKWGVTQDMATRYPRSFLADGKQMTPVGSGPRADMIRIERGLVETQPGPWNFERWAGSRLGEQP